MAKSTPISSPGQNLDREVRRSYSPPTLTIFGQIGALTQGGTGAASETGGMGMGMSQSPKKRP